jgi:predicted alpha/beta superfamily hydrolase
MKTDFSANSIKLFIFLALALPVSADGNCSLEIANVRRKKILIEIDFIKSHKCKVRSDSFQQDTPVEKSQKAERVNSVVIVDQGLKVSNISKKEDKTIADSDFSIVNFFTNKNKIDKSKIATLDNTEIRFIKSRYNNIRYKISVSLPAGYQYNSLKYPVVYILDGHYSFTIAHGISRYLQDKGLQKFILVGIGYDDVSNNFENEVDRIEFFKKNRTRDYTPLKSTAGVNFVKYQDVSGQGVHFREFIDLQLIKFVDKNYNTNGNNTLAGHSYGGLFAMWNYVSGNSNFKNFIAISPSCWYENMWILELIKKTKLFNGKLYFSVGSKETQSMIESVKGALTELRKKEQSREKIKFETIKDESHETLFSSSFIHAVSFVFKKS